MRISDKHLWFLAGALWAFQFNDETAAYDIVEMCLSLDERRLEEEFVISMQRGDIRVEGEDEITKP